MESTPILALITCVVALLVIFLIIVIFTIFSRELDEIKSLLYSSGYIRFDPKIDKLVDFAVDYWRLKKYVEKIKDQISPEDAKRINGSLRRFENYLHTNDIEVNDYAGRSADDGINVEIVSVEHDPTLKKPLIKETITPAVLYKGNLRKKSQIIVLDNLKDKEQQNGKK